MISTFLISERCILRKPSLKVVWRTVETTRLNRNRMLSKIARLVKRFPVRFLDFYRRLSRNRIAHFNVRFSGSDRWSKHFTLTIRVSLSGKQSVSFPISQRSSQHINRFRCISMPLFRKFPLFNRGLSSPDAVPPHTRKLAESR